MLTAARLSELRAAERQKLSPCLTRSEPPPPSATGETRGRRKPPVGEVPLACDFFEVAGKAPAYPQLMASATDQDPRGTVDLVGHTIIETAGFVDAPENIVVAAKTDRGRWIEEATARVGPARARFRSTYFHWAMAINGLQVAAERYNDVTWQATHANFTISGVRADRTGRANRALLAEWPGAQAAAAHLATAPKMCAWGYIELYAALETLVFDLYRVYLSHNPDSIIRGDDFKELRRLKRAAETDATQTEAWRVEFAQRLDAWHRKKLYDGLEKVFLALFTTAGLKTPSAFKATTPETWSETIRGLALVRHLLVHGEKTVNQELSDFCTKPHSLSLGFRIGEPLRVELAHLQAFEAFTDQLLTAANLSLVEHPDAGA